MKRYKIIEYLGKSYDIFFLIFCFILPFENIVQAIPNIIMLLLILLFPFKIREINWKKLNNIGVKLFSAIFILIVLEIFLEYRMEDFKFLKKLIVPIIFSILVLPIKKVNYSILAMIIGTISLVVVAFIRIVIYINKLGGFNFKDGEHINKILILERPYLGYLSVLCICLIAYMKNRTQNQKVRKMYIVLSIILCGFIILISARMAFITLTMILIYFLILKVRNLKMIVLSIVILLLIVSTFYLNENLRERFLINDFSTSQFDQKLKEEPRTYIWQCAINKIKSNPFTLTGIGFYNIETYMVNCFSGLNTFQNEEHKQWFINEHYNTHNQFLDFYLGGGIINIVLFILFFVWLFYRTYRNPISFSMVFSLLMFCLVENLFHRQIGAYLFIITVIFSLYVRKEEVE